MADVKVKALIGIARFLLACGVGYAIYYYWDTLRVRPGIDPWYVSILAGIISMVFAFIMLIKLKGGGD